MTKNELVKEIATCKKEMRRLMREFMAAKNINAADDKLDQVIALSKRVAELKQMKKENGLIATFKKRLGL